MTAPRTRQVGREAMGVDGPGLLNDVLGLALFIVLGLFVPMLILAEPDQYRSRAWIATLAYTVLAAARLAVLTARGERRLFEFIFWLFTYVFFGLAPSVQLRQDRMPGTTPELDPVLDLPTALLAGVGILATAAGFTLAYRRRGRRHSSARRPGVFERWTFEISVVRLYALSLVGLAASAYYVAKVGVGTLLASRAGTVLVEDQLWPDPSVAGIVRATSSFPVLVAAHGWWSLSRSSEAKGFRRLLAAALTAVSLAVTNPVSSSRYASGVVWGSYLGPAGAYRGRARTGATFASLIGALLFLFPVADLFRRVSSVNTRRSGFLAEYAGNGDYDAFGQMSNAILYNATMPLELGRQLLGQIFFWLPRSIWVEKPVNTGTLLADFRGYGFTNLSAPIWAELLLNFGLIGVPVVSLLIGLGLGNLDRAFRAVTDRGVLPIATAVLPFYLLIMLRGSLLQATGSLVVLLAALAFITAPRRLGTGLDGSSTDSPTRGRPLRAAAAPQVASAPPAPQPDGTRLPEVHGTY